MVNFPEVWWQGGPLIFGHRGASRSAPENTLSAFREAVRAGADGVELDVHLSADDVPVVIHDADVRATTDGRGLVRDMSLAQLQELDAAANFGVTRFSGLRIPTLEEVLAEVGQRLLVNIELKGSTGYHPVLVRAVVDVVARMGMQSRVWFSSFRPYCLVLARQYAPEIPCGLLYGWHSRGPLLLAPITPYEALHPHYAWLTEARIRRAHRRGLRVVTWTVDNLSQARQLLTSGVDALITNVPGVMAQMRGELLA